MDDMFLGIAGTDLAVGDAPGHDHIVFVQIIQRLGAEAVENIHMDLAALEAAGLLGYQIQTFWGGDEHGHIHHDGGSFPGK